MKRIKSYDRELGVTLNDAKTHIVHMSGGFEFLKYRIKRGSRRLALLAHKIRGGICSSFSILTATGMRLPPAATTSAAGS
jgi:hypothetical protein